jgi:Tfp pilus assembly protein PilF
MTNEMKFYSLLKRVQKLFHKGKLKEGRLIIEKAISLCPDKYECRALLGDYYGYKGDYDSALQSHRTALAKNPNVA